MLRKNMGKILIGVCIVASITAVFIMAAFTGNRGKEENTFTGKVEMTELEINSKIPGRVFKMKVSEGDIVKEGDLIAVIESKELEAKVKQAKSVMEAAKEQVAQAEKAYEAQKEQSASLINMAQANVDLAASQYDKAKSGARKQEIESAKALVNKAKAALDYAEESYQRMKRLHEKDAIPTQTLQEVEAKRNAAEADYRAAEEQLSMAQEGARAEDIRAAEAQLNMARAKLQEAHVSKQQVNIALDTVNAAKAKYRQAQAAYEEANIYFEDTFIKAPISGVVTVRNSEPGELVSTGTPLYTITVPSDTWVEVQVSEKIAANLKVGDKVDMKIFAVGDKKIEGKVMKLSSRPDFASHRSTNELDDKDIVNYLVKIEIENADGRLKAGMSVDVTFPKSTEQVKDTKEITGKKKDIDKKGSDIKESGK